MSRSGRFAAWWPRGSVDLEEGREPDPRFTFANERTFLAWSRTALALVVAGLGIVQLLPPFPGVPIGRHLLGVPLIVLGAVTLVVRSIVARHTASIVLSVIGLAAIVSAAVNGARFVADGGQASASLAMALATAVAMLCYATELFLLGSSRPARD